MPPVLKEKAGSPLTFSEGWILEDARTRARLAHTRLDSRIAPRTTLRGGARRVLLGTTTLIQLFIERAYSVPTRRLRQTLVQSTSVNAQDVLRVPFVSPALLSPAKYARQARISQTCH